MYQHVYKSRQLFMGDLAVLYQRPTHAGREPNDVHQDVQPSAIDKHSVEVYHIGLAIILKGAHSKPV